MSAHNQTLYTALTEVLFMAPIVSWNDNLKRNSAIEDRKGADDDVRRRVKSLCDSLTMRK